MKRSQFGDVVEFLVGAVAVSLGGFCLGMFLAMLFSSLASAEDRKPVETSDSAVVVHLSGEKLEIKTIDLSTNEGLTAFSQWGSDYQLDNGRVQDISLTTFTKVIDGNPLYQSTARLFKRDGDKITYLDVPGRIDADAAFMINGHEYIFVGRNFVGASGNYHFSGRLVNVVTGEVSKEAFVCPDECAPMVAPDKKLYIVATDTIMDIISMDGYPRWLTSHHVYTADGQSKGLLTGPRKAEFSNSHTLGGIVRQFDGRANECQYEVALDLKTGKTKSGKVSCKTEDDKPAVRPTSL